MSNVEVAVPEPAILGECPLWSAAEGVLYWIDIDGHQVHRLDPSSGVDVICDLPARPGAIALTERPGTLLLGMEHELLWLDFDAGSTTPFVTLESPGAGIRINDSRTDPAGRFIVGSMYEDTKALKTVGSLHQVEANGTSRVLRSNVGTANGLGFDTDRGRMYFADTPTQKVVMWDYDPASGSQTNEREFFDYETIDGKPDGACVDADGCYWSASVYGWAVTRITPDGVVDQHIDVPVEKPSMPAFGGAGLDTLFVTSIGGGTTTTDPRSNGVAPGSLLAIDLGGAAIQGRLDPAFAGTPPT